MTTINISNSIKDATSQDEVVKIINGDASGHVEVMEGIEFTPAQLAGQYAHAAAAQSGYMGEAEIEAHLDIIEDAGANFDYFDALAHGMSIAAAKADSDE